MAMIAGKARLTPVAKMMPLNAGTVSSSVLIDCGVAAGGSV